MSAKIIEHDAVTGITIERDPTTEELAFFANVAEQEKSEKQAAAAKEATRAAALAKLGLTADEIAALFG